mgnify:CR=1 FL=1
MMLIALYAGMYLGEWENNILDFHEPIDGVMESYEIIERMYKASGAENNVKLVIGDGGHRFYANKAYAALKGDWE